MCRKNKQQTSEERLRILEEERVAMVMRHEKPVIIHAVSEAYLKAYKEVHGED